MKIITQNEQNIEKAEEITSKQSTKTGSSGKLRETNARIKHNVKVSENHKTELMTEVKANEKGRSSSLI